MGPLAQIFLEATGEPQRAAAPKLEEILSALIAAGQAAWPAISLEHGLFLSVLAEKTRGESDLEAALRSLRAGELYLTCACAQGDPNAIAAFDTQYLAKIEPALHRLELSADKLDEIKQVLRHRLLVAEEEGKPPLIRQYSGRGPLLSWVTVAATRRALNLLRDGGREVPVQEETLQRLVPATGDPELHYLKEHYRADLCAALKEGLQALGSRELNLLQLRYAEGLTTREIGSLYQVHQTTAAKWLSKAEADLLLATKRALGQRLAVDEAECESIIRLVQSRLDFTLRSFVVK
jgi:RNA polymerase sigma-70 factor (ECF subfamily)